MRWQWLWITAVDSGLVNGLASVLSESVGTRQGLDCDVGNPDLWQRTRIISCIRKEVFILAHYGPPNTETLTVETTTVQCHKNSWIYSISTYYWWLFETDDNYSIRFEISNNSSTIRSCDEGTTGHETTSSVGSELCVSCGWWVSEWMSRFLTAHQHN